MPKKKPADNHAPGPEPDRLKLEEDDWEEAVKKAIGKKRPEGGWPKPDDNQDGEGIRRDDRSTDG